MQNTKPTSVWLKIIAVIWMVWVFLDYWFKHPLYVKSFASTFIGIVVMHVLVAVVGFYFIRRLTTRIGYMVVMLGLFLAFLWSGTLVNLFMYSDVSYTPNTVFLYFGRTILFVSLVLGVISSAYLIGGKVLARVKNEATDIPSSVNVAVGLSVFMIVIFMLLVFGLFSPWTLAILFGLPFILNLSELKHQVTLLKNPIDKMSSLSSLGIVCVILILLMNAITFGHTLSPFPTGFDALNHYINLPKLLAESGHLIKGYQPYNWSLLQAAAVKLTGRIELALIFSWMGLLIVQWASYEFGKNIMKLPATYALLGVVFFTYMPSVTTQASQELKVDLGLTFMLLAMVMAGFVLLNRMANSTDKKGAYSLAIVIGMLGGFALGIKLTAVIALFALVGVLWYSNLGKIAFFGVFLICVAIVFVAQLDSIAGLRIYHQSVAWLQYAALVAGLGMLLYSIRQNFRLAIKTIVVTVVMTVSACLAFLPWMVKNYTEAENPSFMVIINGGNHGPSFNLKSIDKNFKQQNK